MRITYLSMGNGSEEANWTYPRKLPDSYGAQKGQADAHLGIIHHNCYRGLLVGQG